MRYDGCAFQLAVDDRRPLGGECGGGCLAGLTHSRCTSRAATGSVFTSPETVMEAGLQVHESIDSEVETILSPEALTFVADLHRRFNPRRQEVLQAREERQAAIDAGAELGFLSETRSMRDAQWQVAPAPPDLLD